MEKRKKLTLAASIVGGIASLSALVYIIWQHKNIQTTMQRQKDILQTIPTIDKIHKKMRNLELAQCTDPNVLANPRLASLLQCPPPVSSNQQGPTGPTGPQGPPSGAMAHLRKPSSTPYGSNSTHETHGASFQGQNYFSPHNQMAPHNAPFGAALGSSSTFVNQMPNYGFFGNGPAGMESGSMMPAFAQQGVTGGGGGPIPVAFR